MAINVRPLISMWLCRQHRGQTYDTLSQYAETIELDGIPVKTITLEGLLLTKKTMRDKDVADRIIIERALEVFKLHAGGDDGGQGKE
jgi:hypothetical protein